MEQLKADRAKQIQDIRESQARSIMRDEEDFHRVAKIQRELHEKDMAERKRKRQERMNHRRELLKQINDKEKERIQWQREKFEEGRCQRLETDIKDRCVANYLKQKVDKLRFLFKMYLNVLQITVFYFFRSTDLEEHYVKDIERQLKIK